MARKSNRKLASGKSKCVMINRTLKVGSPIGSWQVKSLTWLRLIEHLAVGSLIEIDKEKVQVNQY